MHTSTTLIAPTHRSLAGINCNSLTIDCILAGHGNAVNEVKTHSVDDCLILSASKDERCVSPCTCLHVFESVSTCLSESNMCCSPL